MCRKCTGTTSLTGSPNSLATSPEADGHGEFSPQRVQTARWTSPITNKLLLEAGFGTTYYEWGGKELDPNPNADLVRIGEPQADDRAGRRVGSMRYRSQIWLDNQTRGSNWNAAASYVTGSHSIKVGYQGNYWRDDREMHTNNQSSGSSGSRSRASGARSRSRSQQYINPFVVNARAMQTSIYAQDQWTHRAPHAAGRPPLRQSLELVPGAGRCRKAGSSPAPRSQGGRRHGLQRHHAASGRRL